MALLVASPWLVVQLGIAVLAPGEEITEMPNVIRQVKLRTLGWW